MQRVVQHFWVVYVLGWNLSVKQFGGCSLLVCTRLSNYPAARGNFKFIWLNNRNMWTFIHSSVRLLQPNKKKRWVNCKKKKKDILSKRKLTAVLCVFRLSSSKLFCVCVRESTAKGQVRELKKNKQQNHSIYRLWRNRVHFF